MGRIRATNCKTCGIELTEENNRTKMPRSAYCYTHWREMQTARERKIRTLTPSSLEAASKWNPDNKHRRRATHCKKCGVELTPQNNGLPGMDRTNLCFTHWREKKNEYYKDYYLKNLEKCRQWKREGDKRNYIKRRAKSFNQNNGGNFLTQEDLEAMLLKQLRKCAICACELIDQNWDIDHIVPASLGGGHQGSNLQLLCTPCNIGKWHFTQDQYIEHCKKVAVAQADNQERIHVT